VIYLLDGDSLFPILAAEHLLLTIDDNTPEVITVGIAYGSFDPSVNKRDLDYTPPTGGMGAEIAGAPAFQQFLKAELIPAVESKYRTDPTHRVLVGQSRGGSFVLYSAFSDPDLFWGRIASNPSFNFLDDSNRANAPRATRNDLGLVVTSGTHDRLALREAALRWFKRWDGEPRGPWAVKTISLEGGTHSADIASAYRDGIEWLLGRTQSPP
jgi:predicted alpha/beta superfamily hydrolase